MSALSREEAFGLYAQTLENLVRSLEASLDHARNNRGEAPMADVEAKRRLRDEAKKRWVDAVNAEK